MPGVKGAHQKTARQRELDGSRRRPHHYEQPTSPEGQPVKPGDLTELEALHWDALIEVLRARGQLTTDLGAWLRSVVQAWDAMMKWHEMAKTAPLLYMKATTDLAGNTREEPRAHPVHQQARLARKHYVDLLKEGGLTPASVVRVKLPAKPAKDVDPFVAFQRQGLRAVK